MLMEEYNEAEVLELTLEEGKEEGRKEGRKEGRAEGQLKMLIIQSCRKLRKGKNASQIAEELEEDLLVIQNIVITAADFAPDDDTDAIFALMISKKGGCPEIIASESVNVNSSAHFVSSFNGLQIDNSGVSVVSC